MAVQLKYIKFYLAYLRFNASLFLHLDKHLQFIFRCIDHKDFQKPYILTLSINEEGAYKGKYGTSNRVLFSYFFYIKISSHLFVLITFSFY